MLHQTPGLDAAEPFRNSRRDLLAARAAARLVSERGADGAFVAVRRELRAARQARSRLRFRFWLTVRERVLAQTLAAGAAQAGGADGARL